MQCPKCGSTNIKVMYNKPGLPKPQGFWGWTIWIVFVVCTLGLVLLQPLLMDSSKQKPQAICQTCGHIWTVEPPTAEPDA
jgi:hypothetical protein